MGQRVRATYNDQVLHPVEPVLLRPGATCVLIVEDDCDDRSAQTEYVLTSLSRFASNLSVRDRAERHTEYAHGRRRS